MAAFIFDIDGTIANSFDYIADFLAAAVGQGPLAPRDKQHLRGLSMVAMARTFGIRWWRLPSLFYRGRRGMQHSMGDVEPFYGMPEVITKLHNEGHELFVVSSNSVHNVRQFLHEHNLHTYFLELYGSIGMFSKARSLRKLMRENNLEVTDCVYIGDELRDIHAAKAVNMRMVAVSWGFARRADLQAANPTKLVPSPEALFNALEEL